MNVIGKRWRKFTFPTGNDPRAESFTPKSEPAAMMWMSFLFSAKYFSEFKAPFDACISSKINRSIPGFIS